MITSRRSLARQLSLATLLVMAHPACGGIVLHVDDDAPVGGHGSSWDSPYRFLQHALSVAANSNGTITEIRVAQGVYPPDHDETHPGGNGERGASFRLAAGVALRGGYAGIGAPAPDARDPGAFSTVLTGDLAGDDEPGFVNTGENAYNVIIASTADAGTIVDGLVITAGNANGPHDGELRWIRGGGVWNEGGAPTFTNCVFEANQADWNGGGLCNYGDSPATVTECLFRNNRCLPRYGGGLYSYASSPTISGCTFEGNAAYMGGGIFNHTEVVTISACVFTGNEASEEGGAVRNWVSEVALHGCVFSANTAGLAGGGVRSRSSPTTITQCSFVGNTGPSAAGAGLAVRGDELTMRDSTFTANLAALGGAVRLDSCSARISGCSFVQNRGTLFVGALSAGAGTVGFVSNCSFVRNESGSYGGALTGGASTYVNCVFSRNRAPGLDGDGIGGGAVWVHNPQHFVNCTMSNNNGGALRVSSESAVLSNCVIWGNQPVQILVEPGAVAQLDHTNIEGGWTGPGEGNMSADPLFVQPGTDDLRLAFGSACIGAGDAALLPADLADLDGDGDVREPAPLDLAAQPRIAGAAIDLGAFEGGYPPMPSASSDGVAAVERNETVVLDPGGAATPYHGSMVVFTNLSGPDDASVSATEWAANLYPGGEAYTAAGVTLALETSLAPGQFRATIFIPYGAADLGGIDPLRPRATRFHLQQWSWALAVAANTTGSPGYPGPIGDSLNFVVGEGGEMQTSEIGDYGVSWDPQAQRGFVWANIDRAGDFTFGVPVCPADCRQIPDGAVNVDDLLAVLLSWGEQAGHGPCDIDFDATVAVNDLLEIIVAWGHCGAPATQGPGERRMRGPIRGEFSTDRDVQELIERLGW